MKKKLLTILLSIFTFISAFSTRIFADEHNHNDWKNWGDDVSERTSLPSEEGNYYLTHDVNISSTWNVPGTTNLCLNGHVINANGSNFSAITIGNGATLNLYDCDTTAKHYFTKEATSGLWILAEDQTTPTDYYVTGGVITGGTGCLSGSEYLGGGVYVFGGGTLTMNGGTIAGCSATKGGGVFTWGNFTMNNNSAIIGCTATVDGGGVCACNCEVYMNHNSVVSNCVAGNGAGGVYIFSDTTASFTMDNNSKISDCIANGIHTTPLKKRYGGGVCVEGVNCDFIMNNGTILNCSSNNGGGGGVNVFSGDFNMINGTISHCDSIDGGGVFVNSGGIFTMSNGTISNNKATNCGGGVNNQGTFNMEDGVIEYNSANPASANIYWGGGGVAIYQNGKGTLSGGKIQYNSSTVKGGGILILQAGGSSSQTVSLVGVSITNNTAVTGGGGVYFDNQYVILQLGGNTRIENNVLNGTITKTDSGYSLIGGTKNNLHFDRGTNAKLVTGTHSPNEMSIGIYSTNAKITSATKGDEKYFFADNEEYDAYFNSENGGFIELSYKITDGAHSTINILKDEDASFTSTADYSEFFGDASIRQDCGVKVDGSFIDPLNYTHESGSTKITLKSSYLSTLSIGNHTLSIVSLNGHADTQFTITRNTPSPTPDPTPRYKVPNTGVDGIYSNNHSLLKLSSLSLLAIGTYMVIKKKKDN